MYELLAEFSRRPDPFSVYTAKALWTRPHLARQMLAHHLDSDSDLASRNATAISEITHWIDEQLTLRDKKLCDLGCGPGLYAQSFHELGARVTGVDFSTGVRGKLTPGASTNPQGVLPGRAVEP